MKFDWNDLRFFLAVARTRRITEAAIKLQVSQATVTRRIGAMEDALGTALFSRRNDGYVLTDSGKALVEPAEQAEAQLQWIERNTAAATDAVQGTVRLQTPEILGQHLIMPRLAAFHMAHPDLAFEFIADVRSTRLSKGEADILIRLVRPENGDYTIRKLGEIALGLYCSAEYLARHDHTAISRLHAGHRLIGWETELAYLPMARWLESRSGDALYSVRTHTMGSQLAAAKAGFGIAVLPAFIARKQGLMRVMDEHPPLVTDIWMLQQAASHEFARVRAVADYLGDMIASAQAELLSA
ncbi:LysR family transcriptional regulator [Limoniibacter endophyticus]|uniref:Transcriptional regulator n=1 Tax=Limoniibacter endophyticus TaxID=1565040 RepID=A0A8J3DJ06_9HYPH|nr:LysR family transcriptional regulator [Limoniibacter endophyticus]GHC72091.1 transcriptional regulator [Limoniibacter endophyticus]